MRKDKGKKLMIKGLIVVGVIILSVLAVYIGSNYCLVDNEFESYNAEAVKNFEKIMEKESKDANNEDVDMLALALRDELMAYDMDFLIGITNIIEKNNVKNMDQLMKITSNKKGYNAKIEDLLSRGYIIKDWKNEPFFEVNYDLILKEYGKVLNEDTFDFLNVLSSTTNDYGFITDEETIRLDLVANNIKEYERFLSKHNQSKYNEYVESELFFNKEVYYGGALWTNIYDENKDFNMKYVGEYEKILRNKKFQFLHEDTKEFLETLKENDYKVNANVEVKIMDLMEDKREFKPIE